LNYNSCVPPHGRVSKSPSAPVRPGNDRGLAVGAIPIELPNQRAMGRARGDHEA